MDRKTIKTTLEEIMNTVHSKLTFPAIALTTRTIIDQFSYHHPHEPQPNLETIKEIATTELGWEFRILSDRYAQGPSLVKILAPNLNILRENLSKSIERGYTRIKLLKNYGMQAAFNQYNITYDPEEVISEATWTRIFDELGYIYEYGNEYLIPKPLELPEDARKQILEVLEDLSSLFRKHCKRTNYQQVKIISQTELKEKLSRKLGINLGKHQWKTLLEGILGEALVLAGYSLDKEWVYKDEVIPPLKERGHIFLPAQITRPPTTQPSPFAKGFPISVPAAITDGTTLVYLELLGPRQAVKANWAAIRSGRSMNIYGQGTINAQKEDRFITLKTTLRECGWDHWCLIHQQASLQKMVPEQDFYVIDKGTGNIPGNFYAQLAKAAPFPVLPHWTEYLWVQGRLNDLITALGGTGLGGWKVFFIKEKWEEIVSKGLSEGKIKIINKS